jgi:hypothetical protein
VLLVALLLAASVPAPAAEVGTPASAGPVSAPVGEKLAEPTAEEVALRELGALIVKGAATAELDLTYNRQTRETFPILRAEQQTATATVVARYAPANNLQLSARLPGVFRKNRLFGDPAALGGTARSAGESDTYLGDMAASVLGVIVREGAGRPTVTLSLDGVIPTGPGDAAVGGGVTISKSIDPVVIFFGASYLYGFDPDLQDPRRSLARTNIGITFGYAYAVNDLLALSGQLVGTYRTPLEGPLPPEKESYQLQFGLTWLLRKGLFVEPVVGFAIGSTSPDFTFSIRLPYTF